MAYKVVTRGLESCFDYRHFAGVKYTPNKWTKAKTPMFVFKKLKDAKRFFRHSSIPSLCQIWRCRTKGLAPIRSFLHLHLVCEASDRTAFWREILKGGSCLLSTCIASPGSYRADQVMLTKRVA